MLVFILIERCYQSNESRVLDAFLLLSTANEAMDKYNDSANLDFYATVEEFTCK